MGKMNWRKGLGLILIIHTILLLLKVILVLNWDLELHYEEAQYWLWSKHLDWSYYSKPGMVAWMNALSTAILGDTEIGVKFPALLAGWLMGIGTYLLSFAIVKEHKISVLASLVLYVMPFYYSVTFFHSTDTFLCAFLLFAVLFFWRATEKNQILDWILTGIMLGLAMLSKYAALFFVPYSILYLLATQPRTASWKKWFMAMGIAAVFCLPILLWNIENNWVSFKHVFTLSQEEGQIYYTFRDELQALGEYAGGQAAIISPFLLVLLLFVRKVDFSWREKSFLLFFPAVSFFFFLCLTIYKQDDANINWPMFGYVTLPVFFAYAFRQIGWRKWLLPLGILQLILLLGIGFFRNGDLLPFKLKSDPRMDYVGWREMAQEVESAKQETRGEKTIILASNYQTASAVTFYLQEISQDEVYYISDGRRMNQLFLWNQLEAFKNDALLNIIYIDKNPIKEVIANQFDAIVSEKRVEVKVADMAPRNFYLYRAKGSRDFNTRPRGF